VAPAGSRQLQSAAFIGSQRKPRSSLYMSDWSSFQALDDEDDDVIGSVDTTDYAAEEDSQDDKAAIGATLEPPSIERPAEPIQVPPGA